MRIALLPKRSRRNWRSKGNRPENVHFCLFSGDRWVAVHQPHGANAPVGALSARGSHTRKFSEEPDTASARNSNRGRQTSPGKCTSSERSPHTCDSSNYSLEFGGGVPGSALCL